MANTKPIGVAYEDQVLNGAVIDNSVIGGATAVAGTFSTMTCTTAVVGGNTLSGTELGYVDGITAGTGAASKALVLNASGNVAMPDNGAIALSRAAVAAAGTDATDATVLADQVNAVTGADGTTGVALPAAGTTTGPIYVINTVLTSGANLKVYPVNGGNDNINGGAEDAAFTMGPGKAAWFIPTSATQWYVEDAAGVLTTTAEANILDGVTASAAELNYLDIASLGTGAASKAVVLDDGEDFAWPDTGVLTIGVLAAATEAAEHGAGAIGTAATPTTKRWIERGGIIVTQTTFDLTGLRSVATADDVIGLQAGGAAYIGRNVEATNGVIFKVEFSCLETPTGGDNDVNVVANASAVLAYDGAGGTTYLSNSGDLLKGQTIQNLVPALTEGDYYYLTAGTGDTLGDYTAGMYVLTTYGHAVLA